MTYLAAFRNPTLYHRYLRWDLKNIMDLEIHADKIADLHVRNLVKYFLQQFKTGLHHQEPFYKKVPGLPKIFYYFY
ncbi:MAG: hypothetical protein NT166_14915 [Candidatus Aminicenantes bacterium]|nr:hypothetical protein [Candidatus Aminicenantes bacterium]